jgi:hypothetical protein
LEGMHIGLMDYLLPTVSPKLHNLVFGGFLFLDSKHMEYIIDIMQYIVYNCEISDRHMEL